MHYYPFVVAARSFVGAAPCRFIFSHPHHRQTLNKARQFLLRHLSHYETLGLKSNATAQEIKEAFLGLSKKYHPDKHFSLPPGDLEAMNKKYADIGSAFRVLKDPYLRSQYDLTLTYNYNRGGGIHHPDAAAGGAYSNRYAYSEDFVQGVEYGGRPKKVVSDTTIVFLAIGLMLVGSLMNYFRFQNAKERLEKEQGETTKRAAQALKESKTRAAANGIPLQLDLLRARLAREAEARAQKEAKD